MNLFCCNALFKQFEMSFKTIYAIRLVSSYDEAVELEKSANADSNNEKYNRFPLVYYTTGTKDTTFNFSYYLNKKENMLYIFFNEIENHTMVIQNKEFPKLEAKFKLEDYEEGINNFLDNQFTEAIVDYYKDTKYDIVKIENPESNGLFSLVTEGESSGVLGFKNDCIHTKMKYIFYPYSFCIMPPIGGETKNYADVVSNVIELDVFKENSGKYVYVTNHKYIWMVQKEFFDQFSKEVKIRGAANEKNFSKLTIYTDLICLEV